VDSSVYCLPADLLGEGADRVVGTVRDRAGVCGVTVAACQAAAALGVQVSAWAVLLHRDDLDDRAAGVQENCFGDRFGGRLCPASPAVRDYVLAMTRELCRYPIAALRAEALHYQGSAHGHHHERCLEDYGEITRFLLGLCFCPACAGQARQAGVRLTLLDETIPMQAYATGHGFDPSRELVRAELAVDPRSLAQAGVHLEEPLYLAEPADTSAALTRYRAQLGPDARGPTPLAP
jgi:hypothetical protein